MSHKIGSRRRFLAATGSATAVGLTGCLGGGDGDADAGESLPEGVSTETFQRGPVPQAYRTATSKGGERRDPNQLVAKTAVNFGEASEVGPGGETCENCHEFIPDKNGDGFGACVRVEGYVGADDWCALWEPLESGERGDDGGDDDEGGVDDGDGDDATDTPTY